MCDSFTLPQSATIGNYEVPKIVLTVVRHSKVIRKRNLIPATY